MMRSLLFAGVLLTTFVLCGCTARERAGYSAIPQNSPPSWRMTPYGDLHN